LQGEKAQLERDLALARKEREQQAEPVAAAAPGRSALVQANAERDAEPDGPTHEPAPRARGLPCAKVNVTKEKQLTEEEEEEKENDNGVERVSADRPTPRVEARA